ncbi:MAG: hypothetical protein HUU02_03875 [Bacteroidetes bacterium]|nr:hypothetical protein [Bacteroidota bacterium]
MKDKLLALLKSLGLIPDDKLESVSKELDKLELDKPAPAPIDPSKITDPALKQIVEALNSQVTVLGQQNKTLLDTLTAERTEREKAVKLQQDQAKKDKDQKVADLVAKALKEGKIVKAKEEWLKKYAEADVTAAEEWVKDAPVDKNFKPEPNKGGKTEGGEGEGGEKVKGPLGSVNQGILKNVLAQSSNN